jgi:nucleoid DNA-binding protein
MAKAKASAAAKPLTKTQLLATISEKAGISKKETSAVFDALNEEIKKNLGKRGPGTFAIPGLVKIEKKKVPARPAKKNVPNPFKPGETMDVAAKPASVKIKVRALKALKDMASA